MNKNEAEKLGAQAGQKAFANAHKNGSVVIDKDTNFVELAVTSVTYASDYMTNNGIPRNTAFFDAFVRAFCADAKSLWWTLPEVLHEMRDRAARRWIHNAIEDGTEAVRLFAERLVQAPCYAFEWSDKTIRAAAKTKAAQVLLNVLDGKGLDAAVAVATEEAMRGARWPPSSTSEVSNLTLRYVTAAYAAFADETKAR